MSRVDGVELKANGDEHETENEQAEGQGAVCPKGIIRSSTASNAIFSRAGSRSLIHRAFIDKCCTYMADLP